ncbi:cytochrome P450 [Trinickia sp. LjRoot230]
MPKRAPNDDEPRDLFDLLCAARDPEGGAAFNRAELRDQVGTMIVAGHETSALTLFWSIYLLASAPAEQEAVAAEVRDVDLSSAAAGKALDALPYTRAVINEALRLYPPAWMLVRRCVEPDQIDELIIRRGHACHDQSVGAAPPSPALAESGCIRSFALFAQRTGSTPVRLPTIRHRAASMHRRTVRAR